MERRKFNANLMMAMPVIGLGSRTSAAAAAPAKALVNGERLNAHLAELSQFGKTPEGGTSRVAYSDADVQAREYAKGLMRAARLDVSVDAAGNIVGRRPGTDANAKPLMIGSHIDSVPQGGMYDGQVGSMGAIEVAQSLAEQGISLKHPLEVAIFANEEGITVGSSALAGGLKPEQLGQMTQSGKTIGDGTRFIGGDPARIASVARRQGDVAGFLELHIEQGGTLHKDGIAIGVVTGIVCVHWWDVTIDGFANHAGTTPMDQRHDALLAAAKYVEAVNRVVTSLPGRQVGTVGKLRAFPGANNIVPGKVETVLELRDLDAAKIPVLFERVQEEVRAIEAASGTKFTFTKVSGSKPALCDPRFMDAVASSAQELGLSNRPLPSGAGQDAQEIALLCPIGMVFIPSRDGISHSPKEYSKPEDITNGANVLLRALLKLDGMTL
jgi:beta-ureidopropionase / N-carbamoyl-L-amino-acid hydrolase